MVWENYADERKLSGATCIIKTGSTAAGRLTPGPMDIWIRGLVQGQWTDATIVSVTLATGQKATGQLLLPYAHGQTWWVCQGHNGQVSHKGIAALDLSVRKEDVGDTGCWGDVNASANRPVKAPASGNAVLSGTDGICLNLDSGKSMWIGHLTNRTEGRILRGGQLGITTAADSNSPERGIRPHTHAGASRSRMQRVGRATTRTAHASPGPRTCPIQER
jgi:hypothetical protein